MRKYSVLVVDDEEDARTLLAKMVELFCPDIGRIQTVASAARAVRAVNNEVYDIIFLDIQLGNANGLVLADKLYPYCKNIIFVTAHEDYAVAAFQTNALHYLLKPINPQHLQQAVDRALDQIDTGSASANQAIMLRTRDENIRLAYTDILYLKGSGNYCYFHTLAGVTFVSHNLSYYEGQLPEERFYRIHQSYLINLNGIDSLLAGNTLVKMQDGATLPVAKRKRRPFLQLLGLI